MPIPSDDAIIKQATALAQLFHKHEDCIDQEFLHRGEAFLTTYVDKSRAKVHKNYASEVRELILQAILDLGKGVDILRDHYLALKIVDGKLKRVEDLYDENKTGDYFFKIGLKRTVAFKAYRHTKDSWTESDVQAGIYFLTYLLSKESLSVSKAGHEKRSA